QMPEMDGFEVVTAIRDRERERGDVPVPVIATTAYTGAADRDRALRAGFDAYVSKPIQLDELFAAIDDVTRRRAAELAERSADEGESGPVSVPSGSHAVPSTAPPPPLLDETAALARAGGDRALLAEICGLFLDEVPGWMKDLRAAIDDEDFDRLRRS